MGKLSLPKSNSIPIIDEDFLRDYYSDLEQIENNDVMSIFHWAHLLKEGARSLGAIGMITSPSL